MESANIHHHHQLQDQLVGSSSCLATPSCYGVGSTTHDWTPNTIFSMAPDLGFQWANTSGSTLTSTHQYSAQDLLLSRIKEEFSDHYYLKYTELLNSSPSSSTDEASLRKDEQRDLESNDVCMKLLLKSLSSGNLMNKIQLYPGDLSDNGSGLFSQIFPSNLNHQGLTNPDSLDMNLQPLDLLPSSRFSGNVSQIFSDNQIGLIRDGFSYTLDHMQPFYSSNKVSATAEAKRTSSSKMEPKGPQSTAPKKSRLEGRASCPPFKVRKEKLGDRIAALQQLVAPFGKTDTASVLMEAIGYIKFLQKQVETLSVPYMKKSWNKSTRVMKSDRIGNESEELKNDLKSQGLCLVPLSCMSYITDGGSGGGAVVWPPPHFGGVA